jgi:hypothetical protein
MMKRALQAILIAGEQMRDEVLDNIKTITIREGWRDYTPGPVLLGCHILKWATMRNITDVQYKLLKEVTEEEYTADGFVSFDNMLDGLKRFYPNINSDSEVTVIRWKSD